MFVNQQEASQYIDEVSEPVEQILLRASLNIGIMRVIRDKKLAENVDHNPFDLLVFVSMLHAFYKRQKLVREILKGGHSSYEEVTTKLGLW